MVILQEELPLKDFIHHSSSVLNFTLSFHLSSLQTCSTLLFTQNNFLWAAVLNLFLGSWSNCGKGSPHAFPSFSHLNLSCFRDTLQWLHMSFVSKPKVSFQYHFLLNTLKYLTLPTILVFYSAVLIEYPVLYKVTNYTSWKYG